MMRMLRCSMASWFSVGLLLVPHSGCAIRRAATRSQCLPSTTTVTYNAGVEPRRVLDEASAVELWAPNSPWPNSMAYERMKQTMIRDRHWVDTPLSVVLDDLRNDTGVNIVDTTWPCESEPHITRHVTCGSADQIISAILSTNRRKWSIVYGIVKVSWVD